MYNSKFILIMTFAVVMASCASNYQTVLTPSQNFVSKKSHDSVDFEYKYDLLRKKYQKKEMKKGVKLVAVKITNNSANDLVFGNNFDLTYYNGNPLMIMSKDDVYQNLKQQPASYLPYLLLTLLRLETYSTNNYGYVERTSSIPIGYVLGPGITATNVIAASQGNTKFKQDLQQYLNYGQKIKAGETFYGLIGIRSFSYDGIQLRLQ